MIIYDHFIVDVQMRLAKVLPPKALELLKGCYTLQIGFSQTNESKILYFHPIDHNYFVDNLGNHLANRVHAYYRHQAVQALVVCIPESELLNSSIEKLNMYYGMIYTGLIVVISFHYYSN